MTDFVITTKQISTFEADGVVCLRGVIDQQWLECLWRASDQAMTMAPKDPGSRVKTISFGRVSG